MGHSGTGRTTGKGAECSKVSRVWKGAQSPFLVHYNSSQNNFDQFDVNAMELGLSGFLNGKHSAKLFGSRQKSPN